MQPDGHGNWMARVDGLYGVIGVGTTREAALDDARKQAQAAVRDQLDIEPTEPWHLLIPTDDPR